MRGQLQQLGEGAERAVARLGKLRVPGDQGLLGARPLHGLAGQGLDVRLGLARHLLEHLAHLAAKLERVAHAFRLPTPGRPPAPARR